MGYRHADVPYFSQWSEPEFARGIVESKWDPCGDPRWRSSGFASERDYRFWSDRLCGLACFRSVLAYWGYDVPCTRELLDDALHHGAYALRPDGGVDGLTYAPFARWANAAFGLRVEVFPRSPIDELVRGISATSMAIASVSTEIRYPRRPNVRRGGHLVLVHGWDDEGLWMHNPSGVEGTQDNTHVSLRTFERFYANRGMLIAR